VGLQACEKAVTCCSYIQLHRVVYSLLLKNKLTILLNATFPLAFERGTLSQKLTGLLEVISDGNWHETDQLCHETGLSDSEIREITDFLGRYNFAEVDEAHERVRINKDFKVILTQTV
jgi:hypothetical protein